MKKQKTKMETQCKICNEQIDEDSRNYQLDDLRVCEYCYREAQETDGEYQQARAEFYSDDTLNAKQEDNHLEMELELWRERREQ